MMVSVLLWKLQSIAQPCVLGVAPVYKTAGMLSVSPAVLTSSYLFDTGCQESSYHKSTYSLDDSNSKSSTVPSR